MIAYLLKSACCAIILLLVYRFFLEKEKMYGFNRVYLLFSVVLSILLPLAPFPAGGISPLPDLTPVMPVVMQETFSNAFAAAAPAGSTAADNTTWVMTGILVYLSVLIMLLVRFGRNIYRLTALHKKYPVAFRNGVRCVLLPADTGSYSFLRTIYLGLRDHHAPANEVVTHEMAHVQQKHSVDIIFIELVAIVCWFNPVYLFYKRAIQLNHEFLADQAVVTQCESIPAYQHLLLDRICLASDPPLSSGFNYSITKKRLQMMTQKTSLVRATLKKLALLPVILACFIAFGAGSPLTAGVINEEMQQRQEPATKKKAQARPAPEVLAGFLKNVPSTKEGISTEEMKEYKALENKYLDQAVPKTRIHVFQTITDTDKRRLQSLFFGMSTEQQQTVHILFMRMPEPFKKEKITRELLDRWKDASQYGVWLNDRKIANEELNNYRPEDFSHYFASNLNYTEKMKQEVMKRFNLKEMYKVQVGLMTNSQYDEYYRKSMAAWKENPYTMTLRWGNRKS